MHCSDQFPRFCITVLKTVSIPSFQNFTTTFRSARYGGTDPFILLFLWLVFLAKLRRFLLRRFGDLQRELDKRKMNPSTTPIFSHGETFTPRPEIRSGNHDNLIPLPFFFFFLLSWKETRTPLETTLKSLYLERERKESNVGRDFSGSS